MKELPIQERALKKRSALIAAAAAEFSSAGFEVATAKSIAASAGVATGTFYQYFENKNDILRVIAGTRFEVLHQSIQSLKLQAVADERVTVSQIESQFLKTLVFVHQFHSAEPELHQVLEHRRALDSELSAIMDDGERELQQRVLTFVRSFNLDHAEIIADNLFAMAEGLVHRLVFSQSRKNSDKALIIGAKMLASYFLSNLESN